MAARFCDQLSALQRHPRYLDVHFLVGPDAVRVDGVEMILVAASPFMQEKLHNLEDPGHPDCEGIPLPDLDPNAVQLFFEHIILDAWTPETFQGLPPLTILELLATCRHFRVAKAYPGLIAAADGFIRSFGAYTKTDAFYDMSRASLEAVLSCDELPMQEKKVFNAAVKWAENQCERKRWPRTNERIREVLGKCLFEIRFPIMTFHEFDGICEVNETLLSELEQLKIYRFIGQDSLTKEFYNDASLPFKIKKRASDGQVLELNKVFASVGYGEYVGDEFDSYVDFQSSAGIILRGFSFFGPVFEDCSYDVKVKIDVKKSGQWMYNVAGNDKTLRAQKNKMMHLSLRHPFIIKKSKDGYSKSCCRVHYDIKGDNISMFKSNENVDKVHLFQGIEFRLRGFDKNCPISEIHFDIV